MSYCPNCGKKVVSGNIFCSSCGLNLEKGIKTKIKNEGFGRREKEEKQEKQEKNEKNEKEEKQEKEGDSSIGLFIGGLILVFLGILYYLIEFGIIYFRTIWPYLVLIAGIIVIIGAIYAGITASKRNPKP